MFSFIMIIPGTSSNGVSRINFPVVPVRVRLEKAPEKLILLQALNVVRKIVRMIFLKICFFLLTIIISRDGVLVKMLFEN